jgi:hypothetical protein
MKNQSNEILTRELAKQSVNSLGSPSFKQLFSNLKARRSLVSKPSKGDIENESMLLVNGDFLIHPRKLVVRKLQRGTLLGQVMYTNGINFFIPKLGNVLNKKYEVIRSSDLRVKAYAKKDGDLGSKFPSYPSGIWEYDDHKEVIGVQVSDLPIVIQIIESNGGKIDSKLKKPTDTKMSKSQKINLILIYSLLIYVIFRIIVLTARPIK